MKNKKLITFAAIFCSISTLMAGCDTPFGNLTNQTTSQTDATSISDTGTDVSSAGTSDTATDTSIILTDDPVASGTTKSTTGKRDNTSVCLVPTAPGTVSYSNESAILDVTNSSEGYVVVQYLGKSSKVKLQITGPDAVTYTYNLHGGQEVFPLSAGTGSYTIGVFENVTGNQYATAFSKTLDLNITNVFGAFLYPNQYVAFNADSKVVAKASVLAKSADTDLDVVSNVYNYIIKNISYDYDEAETVKSGYIPVVDDILASGKGICLDYAAVMTSMLRSQQIPTRLEVGYAADAYHAWISTYIKDVGWVNGIIEFDGTNWELMDPTFAANSSEKDLKNFIGNGSNYVTKYIY